MARNFFLSAPPNPGRRSCVPRLLARYLPNGKGAVSACGRRTPADLRRQREIKAAAVTQLALHPDAAPLRLHQMLRNRQPQAGPARLPRPRLVDPVKALKQPPQVFPGDAVAEVPHPEPNLLQGAGNPLRRQLHTRTVCPPAVVQSVLDKVAENLHYGVRV